MHTLAHYDTGLVWFRRDLRVHDNTALCQALQTCRQVFCVFVFDTEILDALPRVDRRVAFIHASVLELDASLRTLAQQAQAGLIVRHGSAVATIVALAAQLKVQAVFAAHDYEPGAIARDAQVCQALAEQTIALHTVKDQVIFERQEIRTQTGKPYTVFTPYKKAWLKKVLEQPLSVQDPSPLAAALAPRPAALCQAVPSLAALGFETHEASALALPTGEHGGWQLFEEFFERMDDYHAARDYPAIKGPSYLGVHLRFGTVSIRQLVGTALQRSMAGSQGASTWLSELVWREFYAQLLANFPHVAEGAFKPEYNAIQWESGPHASALFQAWCAGQTGYPLVDAAMLQLNRSGYMHNRLRMVSGSFLVKDLGLDWRWGEAYFAEKLIDFDLASNNGGWQWVSSSGCDAQPWFRIFNPITQSERFDPQGKFIRRYLPQLDALPNTWIHAPWTAPPLALQAAGVELGRNYPPPLVQHDEARAQTLGRYAVLRPLKTAHSPSTPCPPTGS